MTAARTRKIIGWVAVITFVASVVMFYPPWTRFIVYPLTFCLVSGFTWIIENKKDRLAKGFDLVFFGVVMGVAFPFVLAEISPNGLPSGLDSSLEIFKNIAILACAGAGAGILANHAEHLEPPKSVPPLPPAELGALNQKKLDQISALLLAEKRQRTLHTRLLFAILGALIVLCGILLFR